MKGDSQADILVHSLSKQYPGVLAVKNVSFEVYPGEILGLLGPNGAGKTTTLRILAGMMKPSSGDVKICGKSYEDEKFSFKKKIGFLSGDTQLYDRLTVRETLLFFARLQSVQEHVLNDKVNRMIERLEMQSFADRQVSTLSSGQKQRANIARALVHEPKVLILDEVTASLDILSSQFIIEMIREAKDEGKAIIFSTHIMSEAEYLCDRIALIYEGEVIQQGTKGDLLRINHVDNLTDAFLNEVEKKRATSAHA